MKSTLFILLAGIGIWAGSSAATLKNSQLTVGIDPATGALAGLAQSGGESVIAAGCDRYKILSGTAVVTAEESGDRVLEVLESGPETYRIRCENPALASAVREIIKTYSLPPGAQRVTKRIEPVPASRHAQPAFLEIETGCELAPDFRKHSDYFAPFPLCQSRIPASPVTVDTPMYSSVYLLLSGAVAGARDPRSRIAAASYLTARNDRYCYWGYLIPEAESVKDHCVQLTANGWRHLSGRMALQPDRTGSITVAYTLFDGDSRELCRQVFESSEHRQAIDPTPIPSWIQNVKLMMFVAQLTVFTPETVKFWQQMAALPGPPGIYMPMFDYWGHRSGDCPMDNTDTNRAREMVKLVHDTIPEAKVGTYTILLVGQDTKLFQTHPEGAIRDFDGHYPMADFPGRAFVRIDDDRMQNHFLENWPKIIAFTGCDYWYLDYGDGGAFEVPDYPHEEVGDYADRQHFLQEMKRRMRAANPECGVFFNSPGSLIADANFQEIGLGMWDTGRGWCDPDSNWRNLSDAAYYAKLAVRYRQGSWCSLLYPYVPQRYFAMILALALKPNICPVNQEQFEDYRKHWNSYVSAGFEIKDAQLLDVTITPGWRQQYDSPYDSFVLAQGDNLIASVISHAATPTAIQLNIPQLPEAWRNRPLYARQHTMTPVAPTSDQPIAITAGTPLVLAAGTTLSLSTATVPEQVSIWSVSPVPVWVRQVGDYAVQFRLSETLQVRISGTGNTYTVTAPEPTQLEALVPTGRPIQIKWNETVLGVDVEPIDANWQLAVFTVPATSGILTIQ